MARIGKADSRLQIAYTIFKLKYAPYPFVFFRILAPFLPLSLPLSFSLGYNQQIEPRCAAITAFSASMQPNYVLLRCQLLLTVTGAHL